MDLVLLKKLMKMVDESTINDFELETEGIKIKLSKGQAPVSYVPMPTSANFAPQPSYAVSTGISNISDSNDDSSDTSDDLSLYEIKSPIVGTFYKSPSPESPSFVEVGAQVAVGSTLCIIEAMKLMNEIESDVSGTVVKVLVENGKPVEYNQPLFLIKLD